MSDSMVKDRADAEYKRLKDLLTEVGVSDNTMNVLDPVIVNTSWMKAKLDDSRDLIKNSQIVMPYDNGGGQKGVRENPLFKGYESLWKSYMVGIKQIMDYIPQDEADIKREELERPKTMLELVRNKHVKEA